MPNPIASTLELERPDQQALQDREWRQETIGWGFMAIVVVAAALGLLGPGPMSYRQATSTDGTLSVEYYAIERYESPAELRIAIRRAATDQSPLRLVVLRSFCEQIQLESFSPDPRHAELAGEQLIYEFATARGSDAHQIVLRYRPLLRGALPIRIGLEDQAALEIQQFICP